MSKKIEDILSIMSNLQLNCCLKVDFRKLDQHAGGKWLIHDNKRRKDNQLQSLKLLCHFLMSKSVRNIYNEKICMIDQLNSKQ